MKKIALLLVFIPLVIWAQNPFLSQEEEKPAIYDEGITPGFIIDWTQALQSEISSLANAMEKEGHWGYGLLAFGVAVIFGMVHIAGPGHGKIFSLSYLGSKKAKIREE